MGLNPTLPTPTSRAYPRALEVWNAVTQVFKDVPSGYLTNIAMERSTIVKNGKPSISIRAIEKPWRSVNVIARWLWKMMVNFNGKSGWFWSMETFRLNFHCLMGGVMGGSLIFWRQIRVRLTGLGEPKTKINAYGWWFGTWLEISYIFFPYGIILVNGKDYPIYYSQSMTGLCSISYMG